jgi:hypothetical protein
MPFNPVLGIIDGATRTLLFQVPAGNAFTDPGIGVYSTH